MLRGLHLLPAQAGEEAMMRRLLSEALGTFAMVFAGTGAIVVDQQIGGIGHMGVALVFGLVVMTLIYGFGDTSGAHFNPAVTTAFALAGRFRWADVPGHLGAQLAGALAASAALKVAFPANAGLGGTLPSGSILQSLFFEFGLTFFLMLVILNVSTGAKEKGITAAIAIGGMIGLEALFAGPVSGASMNPFRSLAPAVISGHLEHLWLYLVAPVAGAAAAVPVGAFLHGRPTPKT